MGGQDPGRAERTARRREAALAGHRRDVAGARAALGDPDPGVRATALAALARAGGLTDHDLRSGLADPAAEVRQRVAEVVAAESSGRPADAGPAANVSLLGLLDDPDPSVVEVAAWACGERRPSEPGAVERLAALVTGHDDTLVREAAVAALGALGDERALPAILAAASDRATVRRRAVLALAPFEGPEVDEALRRARTDRDAQVRQAAEDLIGPP